jgi:dienelactone hydrolase
MGFTTSQVKAGAMALGVALTATAFLSLTSMPQTAPVATEPAITARLAPSGAEVALIAGDSIFISEIASGRTRALAGDVQFEAQAARKQLIWSPDSRSLLFRRGRPPFMNYAVVEVASGRGVDLIPDSIAGKLRTVGNLFTGPPVWSPASDRIAFLGGPLDRFGPLQVVHVATRGDDGIWTMRPVASVSGEMTALGWSARHLAWASRARDGSTTITIAPVSGDSIGPSVRLAGGNGRITTLIPNPDGTALLATRTSASPLLVNLRADPRIVPTQLPPETRLDSYVGWLDSDRLMAFRYPSDWRSELVVVDATTGAIQRTVASGGMLTEGTTTTTSRGLRVVFAEEDGSHPRLYRSLIVAADGKVVDSGSVTPPRFALPPDPWSSRIVGWRAEDGSVLEAQLHSPTASPGGPPPSVIVPYGGYRNTALTHTYFLDVLLRQLLAAGWQVIRPNTSAAAVLQQKSGYGKVQLSDTEKLIHTLAAQGVVDPRRVAVVGHSHGATLAYYYATHSKAFCAVVAVNGRTDWAMQARHEGDGLFPGPLGATPDEDPALYAAASPLPNASAVTASMLLVAGADDGQILPVNATAMADSLRAYARPVDLLRFEDEGHLIESPSNRVELIRRAQATLARCQ